MFSQYFGHYLLKRELITRDQLEDALEFQKSVHVKFGVIAVDEGFMTPLQVVEVHEKQKQVDKRFGEIAIELGYLTNDQVDALISNQKQNHLFLAQALVDRGYMTIEKFGEALNDYKKDNSLSDDQFEAIKSGSIDLLVENILGEEDSAKKTTFGKYLSLFAKNMIRFIDDQVYLELAVQQEFQSENLIVHQEILGDSPLFTAISTNKEEFLRVASIYAEEQLTEVNELAKASFSEFLNLHNGIYLVNMSNWGVELSLNPPVVLEHSAISGKSFVVTVNTSKSAFHLILNDNPDETSIDLISQSQSLV